jgi:hypothetical protein
METEMKILVLSLVIAVAAWSPIFCSADPTIASTQALGPFAGEGAPLHPDNMAPDKIEFYGTDLGFSYEHEGNIQFLFGDTWATEAYAPIESSTGSKQDDGFGSVSLNEWPDPEKFSSQNIPLIKLAQNPGSSQMSALDPGVVMDLGHTPMAGFSNGLEEFAIFNTTKPRGCKSDADCEHGLSCDTGLGYYGTNYADQSGLTLPCNDGAPACVIDTMNDANGDAIPGSGFCIDRTSTVWADTPAGRVSAAALDQRIGRRSSSDPRKYGDIRQWLTNKFVNMTARTVERFEPGKGPGSDVQNYRKAAGSGKSRRLLLWGRPGFIGVGKNNRSLGLYFAYVDMPAGTGFPWVVHYYTGSENGIPRFSLQENEAAPADLDATTPGLQTTEVIDIVQQMSVVWIEQLDKWVMFYGGGISTLPTPALPNCGVLQLFTGSECKDVNLGNGAVRMRTADDPWGPWSPPQDVLAGGDPKIPGSGQYGPGGMLHHPECAAEGCAPHTDSPYYQANEYGFLYAANIIEEWIRPAGDGVDVIWNASTWDPYRVDLFRTRIRR